MNKINLAIVGATGLVGQTFLKVLGESEIKARIKNLYLYASEKSDGKEVEFDGKTFLVETLTEKNIKNKLIDYAFFSVDENISRTFAPIFTKCGAVVIDNSSAFRMTEGVPLIVPEVNFQNTNRPIIANPNCSTIQCMLPLKLLQKNFGLKSIIFSTYQAVSGSGVKGIQDLREGAMGMPPKFYPYPIYNNCLPHIGSFKDNGYTSEELKMINETRKILDQPSLKISATCVRVPVENSHSISVSVKLKKNVSVEKVKQIFKRGENLILLDDINHNIYPINQITNGKNFVYVGRLRRDLFDKKTIHFWCVADNIRKGASTNGVQILEKLLKKQ
ncbi:MAG: aspartate-semialdehyde dehydrogenase [Clostridia bacterium]|nr:aspartate-semialdehyde dehydrogenase [Clostridia bacterium]